MKAADLFQALSKATKVDEVETAVAAFESAHPGASWVALGRENNRGTVEAASDPGRSLIERLTNGFDAVLDAEWVKHKGKPDCRSPREAAEAWLGLPNSGLAGLTTRQRQKLADLVTIQVHPGEGTTGGRLVTVWDRGTGILPEQMANTILSLSGSNKTRKRHLIGAYGQGGSSTFAVSEYAVIASRSFEHPTVGFTVVKFYEPPADDDLKVGFYVYLALDENVLTVDLPLDDFPTGTRVQHFDYDLSHYGGSFGPGSVYGLLNQVLFDPVLPLWLDNRVHGWRRTIKGTRNALNGAVDEGDDQRSDLSHVGPMYFVDIGDAGTIGIEYWVLETTDTNKKPIASFVNPTKPIILTLNGQSHAELSSVIVRKNAELPYLRQRIIVHVDCNRLTADARRLLFVSNREEARRGQVYTRIEDEVINALKSDEELERLNSLARDHDRQEQDQEAQHEMRGEVARLLHLQGMAVEFSGVGGAGDQPGPAGKKPRGPRKPPKPIEIHEPPTFVQILWDEDEAVTFYAGQRRYVRIITDADSKYHSPTDSSKSRFNFIVTGTGVKFIGTTPLTGGRMRAIFTCTSTAEIGEKGALRVELSVPGQPVLSAERPFEIIKAPEPAKKTGRKVTMPPIEWRAVTPGDDTWEQVLGWPDNPALVASESDFESGKLIVWYSTAFPNYATQLAQLEQRDPALAKSFTTRYRIWLAVHSLLMWQQEQEDEAAPPQPGQDVDAEQARERLERCRVAALSAMFAMREVKEMKEPMAAEAE